jgi:hypothetical protein
VIVLAQSRHPLCRLVRRLSELWQPMAVWVIADFSRECINDCMNRCPLAGKWTDRLHDQEAWGVTG